MQPRRTRALAVAGALVVSALAAGAAASVPAPAASAAPGLTLTKSAAPATMHTPGQVVTYTYSVTNGTGGTVTGLSLTDAASGTGALSAVDCPATTVADGATASCTATYVVTNADIAAGAVTDTATASATDAAGATVTSDPATATVSLAAANACSTVYWSGRNPAGTQGVFGTVDPATGAYTETGPLTSSSATTALAVSTTGLNLGYVTTYAGSASQGYFYAVDLVSGTEYQMNTTVLAAAETHRLAAGPDGSLWSWAANGHLYKITLSADGLSVTGVTDYGLVTATAGNGTLVQPASLSSGDIALDGAGNVWLIASQNNNGSGTGPSWLYTVAQSSLTPGASTVGAFQVGQVAGGATSNLNNGLAFAADGQLYTSAQVGNGGQSAFYRINPATGAETLIGQSDTTPFIATDLGSCVLPAPALTLTKSASANGPASPGSTLTYTIDLANVGNATATNVALRDFLPANTTYVAGSTTLNGTPVPDQGGQMPYLTLRNVNSPGALGGNVAPGDTAAVTFQVTVDNPLPPGTTAVANHAVATYTGGPSGGIDSSPPGQVTGEPPSDTTIEVDDPGLTVVKSATSGGAPVTGALTAGQVIDYAFTVTNSGNVPLSAVAVTDTAFTGTGGPPTVTCPAPALAPGAQEICTAPYTVTLADVNAGHIGNTAVAAGTPPAGPAVASPPSSLTVPEPAAPALRVVKTDVPAVVAAAGDTVRYSFAVTNTGNVTLTGVHVDETGFTGSGTPPAVTCPAAAASVAPGMTVTCTASYQVTQGDMDAGHIDNTAVAGGTPPSGAAVTSPPSSAAVRAYQKAVITLHKTAAPAVVAAAGDEVAYPFLVVNAGNVTLHDVTVTETMATGTGPQPAIDCPGAPVTLAPRQSVTCTAAYYRATQADIDFTRFADRARADGTGPGGTVAHARSAAVVQAPPRPSLDLVKTATPAHAAAGTRVGYSFTITNTGNDTLHHVVLIERRFTGSGPLSGVSCPGGEPALAPGAAVTCTASYVATTQDAAAGTVANTAVAHGRTSFGRVLVDPPGVTSRPASAVVTVTPRPSPPSPAPSVPGGVRAGYAGGGSPANVILMLAGAGLAIGAATIGGLALATRRRAG